VINEAVLGQIEMAFDIKLYEWQRSYLLGKPFDPPTDRQSGRTFAYIIKLLLSKEMQQRGIGRLAEKSEGAYRDWFKGQVLEIDDQLKAAGIETKLIRQGGENDVI